jgi:hypothetical protein
MSEVLDPSQDPDRYDATKDTVPADPLDLDEGRDLGTWLLGLVSVFGFLLLVTGLMYLRG